LAYLSSKTMVFFTCNSCGESLKKDKVDRHVTTCRSLSVSCLDCLKDFTHDYIYHNQCVSEDQKYGGFDYKAKTNSFKGKAKQEEWIQKVKTTIRDGNHTKHINDLMERLITYDNIPRKKQKFINFVRNSLRITNEYYGQQLWDVFEKATKGDQNDSTSGATNVTKRQSETNESISNNNKKLRPNDHKSNDNNETNSEETHENGFKDNEESNGDQDLESKPKLKINKIIVEILKESKNNELSLKKLKKKVLKKYQSIDENYIKESVYSMFEKKIHKNKKIVINDEIVSLNL